MSKLSAGLLLFRKRTGVLQVLLVHPGGPFWRNKDEHAWSIPKGEFEQGEDALTAARREVAEEIGIECDGSFLPLKPLKQPSGKIVHAWAVEHDFDPNRLRSNTFELEWPPKSRVMQAFPEVDRAEWFIPAVARAKIHKGQAGFIDQITALIDSNA
jgi:predicted NUDIX family NTP pyrophosphohydrolase